MDQLDDFARDIAGGVTGKILHMVVDSWFDAPTREEYEASYNGYEGFLQRGLAAISRVLNHAARPASRIRIIRNYPDFASAQTSGDLALVLGAEGGKLIEESLDNLDAFFHLDLRHIQLNWAMRNQLATSQDNERGPDQSGLTPFGSRVIQRMNELGIIVDVSHSSPATISEVLELNQRPILNSHSGSRVLAPKPQNLFDDQIRAMAENNGVIGMHFCSRLVLGVNDRQAEIPDVVRQIEYVKNIGGIDVVALGPDWILGHPQRDANYIRNTIQGDITWTAGLESSATVTHLIPELNQAGLTPPEIDKIVGGNILRLFRDVLPA